MEIRRDTYSLTDDASQFDIDSIWELLKSTYWASSRTRQQIEISISKSLCVGLFYQTCQIGFARAVTDQATFTWLCDVVVHPEHRNKGLGRWMVEWMLGHPNIARTRIILVTKDAQQFYANHG